MPDLEDRLRDLATLSGSSRRPLGPDELDERSRRTRRAQRARVVLPVVVVALVALIGSSLVVVTRDRSVVDVGLIPSATDPVPSETSAVVEMLRETTHLRMALSHELLDISAADAAAKSPDVVARRGETDLVLGRFRATELRDRSTTTEEAHREVETLLNQLRVVRLSVDQLQTELDLNVTQYLTTIDALTRFERSLADLTDDLATYKRLQTFSLTTDVTSTGVALLARSTVVVSQGRYGTDDGISQSNRCGPDAAGAGTGCLQYTELVNSRQAYRQAIDDLLSPPSPDTPTEIKTMYRATAVVPRAEELIVQVLQLGNGSNDLSAISSDELRAAGHEQLDRWEAFQMAILDRV